MSSRGFQGLFSAAQRYRDWVGVERLMVREPGLSHGFGWTERHVQCVWADSRYRPDVLTAETGESVTVLDPGRWNLEAGPDFLGATLLIEPGKRLVYGDIEVHVRARDWLHHGHRGDERYEQVVVHATWFPGVLPEKDLPAGTIQLSLEGNVGPSPVLLDTIDVTAYPFSVDTAIGSHAALFRRLDPDTLGALLDSAGEERLARKAEGVALAVSRSDPDQVLYEEVLGALGYKSNKAAFRLLARRVPLNRLREEADGDCVRAFALLSGVAGLLPEPTAMMDAETDTFLRACWARWWRMRERWDYAVMPTESWSRSGVRPQNYPERRMMAAAELFTRPRTLGAGLLSILRSQKTWPIRELQALFALRRDVPYWERHYTYGRRTTRPLALVGEGRCRTMVTNVAVPWLVAVVPGELVFDGPPPLPSEASNSVVRAVAHAVLGPDHSATLYRSTLRKQGLLQIFRDFL